jgi:hypothetical protein
LPRRSPFTEVPGRLAELARPRRADLHIHTTESDGEYTAPHVVTLARQMGLVAIAITDHDTITNPEGTMGGDDIEVIPGVEISSRYRDREVHLLGYFIRTDDPELNRALAQLRAARRDRFREFVSRLARAGTPLSAERVDLVENATSSLGRRHLARLVVECGFARTRVEAFHRHLGPLTRTLAPKVLLPVEEAIDLVRAAGGVASLAHPPPDMTDADFSALAGMGLRALEAEYPWGRSSRSRHLREAARKLRLAISGGSDCHGPDPASRRIGSHGIASDELTVLRGWRGDSVPSTC